MKIRFLGTGAADWDVSAPARCRNFRRFSSALIDGALLIDPGPCVFEAAETLEIDLSAVRHVVCTHSHSDHFSAETLERLTRMGAAFAPFAAGELRHVGAYEVEAVAANHGTCSGAVHFLIGDGEKRLFYGLDGAWLLYPEIEAIKRGRVNLMVLDGTVGDVEGDYRVFEHNNLRMVEEMKRSLTPYADRFMISHMAKSLHPDHDTLARRCAATGVEVAYDGMETEL